MDAGANTLCPRVVALHDPPQQRRKRQCQHAQQCDVAQQTEAVPVIGEAFRPSPLHQQPV